MGFPEAANFFRSSGIADDARILVSTTTHTLYALVVLFRGGLTAVSNWQPFLLRFGGIETQRNRLKVTE